MILWLLGGTTVVAVLGFLVASVQIVLALRDQGGSSVAGVGHAEDPDPRAFASSAGDRMFPSVPTLALWGPARGSTPVPDGSALNGSALNGSLDVETAAAATGSRWRRAPKRMRRVTADHVVPTPAPTDPVVPDAASEPAAWSIGLPSAAVPKGFTPPVDYVNDLMAGVSEAPERPAPPTWEAQTAPTAPRSATPIRTQPVAPETVAEKDDFVPVIVRDIFLLDEDEDR